MLFTGGAGLIDLLTGAPTAVTVFLFPIGAVIYTLHGGIKATFIAGYINTLVFFDHRFRLRIHHLRLELHSWLTWLAMGDFYQPGK